MPRTFAQQFAAARAAAAPLVAVRTPDPASTIRTLMAAIPLPPKDEDSRPDYPVLYWDLLNGLVGLNDTGKQQQKRMIEGDPAKLTAKPSEMLRILAKMLQPVGGKYPAQDVTVFMANAHRYWSKDEATLQGIWNVRDSLKLLGGMLVCLTTLGADVPDEIANDVLILDEPLPSSEELKNIVKTVWESAEMSEPLPDADMARALDATAGLAAFPAEQALAMSITQTGLDIDGLWERKRQIIETTPGLSVWRGSEKFSDIGGYDNLKTYLRRYITCKNKPTAMIFVDEIEKAFAGTGTDSSGVKSEMTGAMLTWMQNHRARGIILIGPAGTGKSAFAKAAGNEANIPTIAFDLSAMQDSLVGKSGERLRAALKVVDAVSQDRAFFIATCNNISSLPPELRRRFKRGTFFMDLPNQVERESIWKLYESRYRVNGERPPDHDWTGAEIEQCCEQADELGITLLESSGYVVPVARAMAERLEELRSEASGKYISASESGVYVYRPGETSTTRQTGRKIRRAVNLDMGGGNA